jgi:TonB family protein
MKRMFFQLLSCGFVVAAIANGQGMTSRDLLESGEIPGYPPTALAAGISGVVEARIKVNRGVITQVDIVSGQQLLGSAVQRVLRTWRFGPAVSTADHRIKFQFELSDETVVMPENPLIELRLPNSVRVRAYRVRPLTVDHEMEHMIKRDAAKPK